MLSIGLQTLVDGVMTGLTYAVFAAGLVLIYRASGVVNFAHGEIGAFSAAAFALLVLDVGLPYPLALPVALAIGMGLAFLVERVVVRRLSNVPRLLITVATIGVAQLVFVLGQTLISIESSAPFPVPFDRELQIGPVQLLAPEFAALLLIPAALVGLTRFLNHTPWGTAIRAAAENPEAARLGGIDVRRISTIVWVIAGLLAALTIIVYNPLRSPVPGAPVPAFGPALMLRALAAALVGRMSSIPLTLAGGIAVGVVEALLLANLDLGTATAVLAAGVVVLVLLRGRDHRDGPALATGTRPLPPAIAAHPLVRRLPLIAGVGGTLLAAAAPLVLRAPSQQAALSRVLVIALVALSLSVLTGWAGQLSLGQFAFTGLGALVTAALVVRGMPFGIAIAYAVVASVAVALAVGQPALRVRGIYLAVTTLAFAVAADAWLFRHPGLVGDSGGVVTMPRATLGPLDLADQRTFYWVTLAVLVVTALLLRHLRGTGIGRSLLAVRDNEASAAAFTVSPTHVKLLGFALSGAVAGLAGGLLGGLLVQIPTDGFGVAESLRVVSVAVVGGLGTVSGPLLGAALIEGVPILVDGGATLRALMAGAGLLVVLLLFPGGLAAAATALRDVIVRRIVGTAAWDAATRDDDPEDALPEDALPEDALPEDALPEDALPEDALPEDALPADATLPVTAEPAPTLVTRAAEDAASGTLAPPPPDLEDAPVALAALHMRVRFGGLVAVDDVSITAARGEVVGLIGSNGAGKSTLMNAITGLVPAEGYVRVGDRDVTADPPHRRAAAGLGRAFQNAALFADLTVRETVGVALEARQGTSLVPSLLSLPPSRRLERWRASAADDVIDLLGLGRYAPARIRDLSTGTRRIVELACLLATGSRVLLLDEPTAGVAQREAEVFGPLIRRIRHELGATIVIIEHDLPMMLAISDRVYAMAAGAVIAEGAPADVRDDPAVVAAYLGTDERAIARSGEVAT
jgi:ABC-type branched-subunit amino acid transport system ATPase component/ABC-type branched-subunit amino acid transport system permease subunit